MDRNFFTANTARKLMRRAAPPTVFGLLLRAVVEPFLLAIAAFAVIHLLADTADRFNLIAAGSSVLPGIQYLLLRVPGNVSKLLPVALLAGVMFGFARMNRTGEVVAMQALGVSRLQMAAPLFAIAMLVTVSDFVISETIVPVANTRAQMVLNTRLRKQHAARGREAWVRTRDAFVFAANYDPSRKELSGLTILKLSANADLRSITQAQRANWNGRGWSFVNSRSLELSGDELAAEPGRADATLNLSPADFDAPLSVNPEELSLSELNRFILTLSHRGLNPRRYLNLRDLKFALPFSCLILAAIGFAISLDPLPRHGGYTRNIAAALGAGFGYWLMLALSMSFGKSGLLPPWLGAWLPNFMFGSLALGIFLMGEEK